MNSKAYQRKIQQQTNRLMVWFVVLLYGIGLWLASLHSTWEVALGVGTVSLLLFLLAVFASKEVVLTRQIVGLVLATFVWQFIHQLKYIPESYYFFFVVAAVLVFYQDARVFVPYALVFCLSQTVVYYNLTQNNYSNALLWGSFGINTGLIASMVLISAWVAYLLGKSNYENYENALQAEEKLKALKTSLDWIIHISEGELGTTNDQVLYGITGGNRLIEMKNRLVQARALEEKEKFVNLGLAQISEVVSDHDYDLEDLSRRLLNQIVRYFEAQQGTLYLLEDTDDGETLVLKAAYACNPEKENRHLINKDEGFIGQALQSRNTLSMHDTPSTYFKITSGLGGMMPNTVVAVPIQTTEDIVGVIELATLNSLEPFKIELLEKMAETIASSILSIKFNTTTTHLLMESRELAARLQAQEDEIRHHLEDTAEQLAEKDREIAELKAQKG